MYVLSLFRKYSPDRILRAICNHDRKVIIAGEPYITKRYTYCAQVNRVPSDVVEERTATRPEPRTFQ